jgi:hypothetical protein
MVKTFKDLKDKYFPRGGNTRKLGVSKDYLELVIEGVVPPSQSLLFKAKNAYNIHIDDIFSEGVMTRGFIQPLFVASESLSNNPDFLRILRRHDSISEDDLANLVGEFYPSIHVKGRLSTILTNMSNFFILASADDRLDVHTSSEFNQFARLKNPFVCIQHEDIDPYVFMNYSRDGDVINYSVVKDFLPLNIKSIKTDSLLWRKRFLDKGPRSYLSDDDFNKVLVEYKKPISVNVLDSVRLEVEKPFQFPEFNSLYLGLGNVIFNEQVLFSKLTSKSSKLVLKSRPAISLVDDNTLGFYYYPVQILSHSMSAGGGDNYFPAPQTLSLANRIQNYLEGRVK